MRLNVNNPVLVKEIKLRFRSLKSFTGILFYLIAMSIFVFGYIFLTTTLSDTEFFRPEQSFLLFSMLSFIQLGLILFITPGLTAGAISTEREKQTLNMLLTTSQSSFQIIAGKLTSSVAFLFHLILAGLPVYSLVFLFGGISPSQLALILAFSVLTMIAIGSIGIMFSTLIRKTIVSMIATYGAMIFLAGVTGFFFLIASELSRYAMGMQGVTQQPEVLAHVWASINPVVLILTFLQPEMNNALTDMTNIDFPIWAGYLIFYSLLSVVAIWIAVKKLRVNMKRKK